MPNLAAFHPQIVHFVIALLIVGVAMRIVSLTGRLRFTSPAATTLILIGTVAAWLAVRSGTDAHGPVERIPGARAAVMLHEEHAKAALNVFLIVAAAELIALAMSRKESVARHSRWVFAASALVGVYGCFQLYETGEHGGELVYSYGGGPGLRTGDPRDVERMLLAGLYNQMMADRKAGRAGDAADLSEAMLRRFGGDTTIELLRAESLLLDAKNPDRALGALDSIKVDSKDARLVARKATLKADIQLAMARPDAAKATLLDAITSLPEGVPQRARLQAKIDSIRK
jgi:uncharacterized membrane protein